MVYKNASTHEREGYGPDQQVTRFGSVEGVVMTGLLNLEGFEQRSDLSPKDKIDALTPEELKKFALQLKQELQQALKGHMDLAGLLPDLENSETSLTDIEVARDLSGELLRHVEFVHANFDTLKMYVEAYADRLRDSGSSDQLQLAQDLEDLIGKIESGREATATVLRLIQSGLRRVLMAIHQIKIGHLDVFSKKGLWEKISERDKNVFARYANSPSYVETNVKTPVEPSLARYRLSQLRGLMTGRTARKLAAGGATFAAGAIATTAMAGSDMPAQVAEHLAEADVCPDGQDNATINQIIKDLKSVLGIDVTALRDYVARCEMLLGNEVEVESPTFGGIVDGSSAGDTSVFDSQFATDTETEVGTPRPEQNSSGQLQVINEYTLDPRTEVGKASVEYLTAVTPTELANQTKYLLWFEQLTINENNEVVSVPEFPEGLLLNEDVARIKTAILQQFTETKTLDIDQVNQQKIGLVVDKSGGSTKVSVVWQSDIDFIYSDLAHGDNANVVAGTVMIFNQEGRWRYMSPTAPGETVEIWSIADAKNHLPLDRQQDLGIGTEGKVLVLAGADGKPRYVMNMSTLELMNPDPTPTELVNKSPNNVNLRATPTTEAPRVDTVSPNESVKIVSATELPTLQQTNPDLFARIDFSQVATVDDQIVYPGPEGEWVVVRKGEQTSWVFRNLLEESAPETNDNIFPEEVATPPAPVTGQDLPEQDAPTAGQPWVEFSMDEAVYNTRLSTINKLIDTSTGNNEGHAIIAGMAEGFDPVMMAYWRYQVDGSGNRVTDPATGQPAKEFWRPFNAIEQQTDFESGWVRIGDRVVEPVSGINFSVEAHGFDIDFVQGFQQRFVQWLANRPGAIPDGTNIFLQVVNADVGYNNPDVAHVLAGTNWGMEGFGINFDPATNTYFLRLTFPGDLSRDNAEVSAFIPLALGYISDKAYEQQNFIREPLNYWLKDSDRSRAHVEELMIDYTVVTIH